MVEGVSKLKRDLSQHSLSGSFSFFLPDSNVIFSYILRVVLMFSGLITLIKLQFPRTSYVWGEICNIYCWCWNLIRVFVYTQTFLCPWIMLLFKVYIYSQWELSQSQLSTGFQSLTGHISSSRFPYMKTSFVFYSFSRAVPSFS